MATFVNIVGYPVGATVLIDRVEVGITPLYYLLLKWGKYHVEIRKEGYESEFRDEFVVFKTDRKKTIAYRLKEIEEAE